MHSTGLLNHREQHEAQIRAAATRQPLPKVKPEAINGHATEIPFESWPVWARLVSRFRAPGDSGVGATLEHWQGHYTGGQFKFWFYCVFGKKTACPNCPGKWNREYAYKNGNFSEKR